MVSLVVKGVAMGIEVHREIEQICKKHPTISYPLNKSLYEVAKALKAKNRKDILFHYKEATALLALEHLSKQAHQDVVKILNDVANAIISLKR